MHAGSLWQNPSESDRLGDLVVEGMVLKDEMRILKTYDGSMQIGFIWLMRGICENVKYLSGCIKCE